MEPAGKEGKYKPFREQAKPVSLQLAPLSLLPASSCDFCRQERPGLLQAVPRDVPAWEDLFSAGTSSAPQELGARTSRITAAVVLKSVRNLEGR